MHSWSQGELGEIQKEVNRLLSIGAIVACEPVEGQFISSFFLVPKPDSSNKFIINLKALNNFLASEHFKMEDIRTVCKLVWPDVYLGSIDLKDAYFLIPLHKDYRKFVTFVAGNCLYEFTCLYKRICIH